MMVAPITKGEKSQSLHYNIMKPIGHVGPFKDTALDPYWTDSCDILISSLTQAISW